MVCIGPNARRANRRYHRVIARAAGVWSHRRGPFTRELQRAPMSYDSPFVATRRQQMFPVLDAGEIGDICAWQTKKLGNYTVQLEWSNKNASCK